MARRRRTRRQRLIDKRRDEQRWLAACGWPIRADGVIGPRTRQARRDFRRASPWWVRKSFVGYRKWLQRCARRNGRATEHFYFREWKSKGNGWIKVDYELLKACEKVRSRAGAFSILSGYRDPLHNARIGGATQSQHLYGTACDPSRRLPLNAVTPVSAIKGVGICSGSNSACCHMDVRRSSYRVTWHY